MVRIKLKRNNIKVLSIFNSFVLNYFEGKEEISQHINALLQEESEWRGDGTTFDH
jgi:hypothetical protein